MKKRTAKKPVTKPRIVTVHQGEDGQFYWREQGRNGQITQDSEGYTRLADAVRAAKAHCAAKRVFVDTTHNLKGNA